MILSAMYHKTCYVVHAHTLLTSLYYDDDDLWYDYRNLCTQMNSIFDFSVHHTFLPPHAIHLPLTLTWCTSDNVIYSQQ